MKLELRDRVQAVILGYEIGMTDIVVARRQHIRKPSGRNSETLVAQPRPASDTCCTNGVSGVTAPECRKWIH